MANIRIKDLPADATPSADDIVPVDGASTRGPTIAQLVDVGVPVASQSEAETGTNNTKRMTPLTVKQSIQFNGASFFASTEQGALADTAIQPSAIGVSVQAHDAFLDALAAMTGGSEGQVIAFDENGDPVATNAGAGDMLTPVYDTDDIAMDAFGGGIRVATRGALASATVTADVGYIQTVGYASSADGGGALYKRVETEPSHAGKVQSADGAWWELANEVVKPAMFGAVGDGVVDDTTAVTNAMNINRPLEWGDSQKVYRVTSEITFSPTRELAWTSSGATIFYGPAVSTQFCLRITVPAGDHKIEGVFNIDANRMAYVGFSVGNATTPVNFPDDYPNFTAVDLRVYRAHRAAQTFTGGDGISIAGGFNRVQLVRPHVEDISMATGAIIPNSNGVTGITISRNNTNGLSCRQVVIEDPFVYRVYSEDAADVQDQAGIRIFQYYDDPGDDPAPVSAIIRGGVIKNSRNRSVKMQTQFGQIAGLKLEKDDSIDLAGGGVANGADIHFQVGGGLISELEVLYDGFVPAELIRYSESTSATKKVAGCFVSGIRGTITGGVTLPILGYMSSQTGVATGVFDIERVHLFGSVEDGMWVQGFGSGGIPRAGLSKVYTTFTRCAIYARGSGDVQVDLDSVHNLGTAVPVLFREAANSVRAEVSASKCRGFTDNVRIAQDATPTVERSDGIAPRGAPGSLNIPAFRHYAFDLDNGAEAAIPWANARNGSLGMMILGTSWATTAQAILAFNSGGFLLLTPEATSISAGTTSDPGAGTNIRLWYDAGEPGPRIKNSSGSARTIYVILIG